MRPEVRRSRRARSPPDGAAVPGGLRQSLRCAPVPTLRRWAGRSTPLPPDRILSARTARTSGSCAPSSTRPRRDGRATFSSTDALASRPSGEPSCHGRPSASLNTCASSSVPLRQRWRRTPLPRASSATSEIGKTSSKPFSVFHHRHVVAVRRHQHGRGGVPVESRARSCPCGCWPTSGVGRRHEAAPVRARDQQLGFRPVGQPPPRSRCRRRGRPSAAPARRGPARPAASRLRG